MVRSMRPFTGARRGWRCSFSRTPPLTDGRAGGGPRLDTGPPVGGQAVFPALVQHGADTAGEAAHRQGNRRNGKHQTALLRPVPDALRPQDSYLLGKERPRSVSI